MIRFKKAAAADVPVPPAGYVTLFVDTATGQPSAKDSAGLVVSLKGTDGEDGVAGLPEGGTLGQVLTRSADGAAWADVPTGEGGEMPFVNVLDDAYFVIDDAPTTDPHMHALVQYEYESSGASRGVRILAPVPNGKRAKRVRVTVIETLSGTFDGTEHTGDSYDMPPLANNEVGVFTLDMAPSILEGGMAGIEVGISLTRNGELLPIAGFLGFELTGFQMQLENDGAASYVDALALTTIPVIALDNGGNGGSRIPKTDFPGATEIEILGYYDFDAMPLDGVGEFYPPAWPESGYVAVTPTAIDPTFLDSEAWGWYAGSEPIAFPAQQFYLCKVSIDGAAPVYALLNANGGG